MLAPAPGTADGPPGRGPARARRARMGRGASGAGERGEERVRALRHGGAGVGVSGGTPRRGRAAALIQALRFQQGQPAQRLQAPDLPAAPGGGIWCDLARADLPPADGGGQGGLADVQPLARWLAALHPLTVAHLRDAAPHGMAAAQEHYVHVRLRLPLGAPGDRSGSTAVDVVLAKGFALSVHDGGDAPWGDLWEGYAAGRHQADGVDFAIYQALVRVNRTLRRHSDLLLAQTERLVERLTDKRARSVLSEIVRLRRASAHRRGDLAAAVDAYRVLGAAAEAHTLDPEVQPFYRDLEEEAHQLLAAVEEARGTMAEGVEAYTSVQSTEMNRVMQIFTVVAVVFMPPTLIASIYGMNFRIPEYHWSWGYPWSLSLMAATSVGLWIWFKRRDYL